MADTSKEKLPNLKICIDNTEENSSDDDNLSLKEEGDFDEEEEPKKKVPVSSDSSSSDSDDVEFNVRLDNAANRNRKSSKIQTENVRKYENKSGNFVTGIDFTKQEEKEKREERAKRFGVKLPEAADVDLGKLYKSLGIKEEDLDRKDERGIRLEAIHIRGVDNMNTNDVFNFFQEFAPGSCEWIDDTSCNILWMDRITAARAMLKLSKSYEEIQEEQEDREKEKKKEEKHKDRKKAENKESKEEEEKMDVEEEKSKPESESKAEEKEKSSDNVEEEKVAEERKEEKMEEDDDELDLTEDIKETEKKSGNDKAEEVQKTKEEDQKSNKKVDGAESDGVSEEGELPDSNDDDDNSRSSSRRKSVSSSDSRDYRQRRKRGKQRIPWPPGKWRLGIPHSKAKFLFLRYATKADHKLPGAEKRSRFYRKYGNPNYGGMTGLISQSRKRKINARRFRDEEKETQADVKRTQVSYAGVDMFTDFGVHNYDDVRQIEEKGQPEVEKSDSEDDYHPVIEKKPVRPARSDGSDDSSVDEEELERLLGSPVKKRTMRMYADDVEDDMKERKRKKLLGSLAIVTDTRKKPKRVQDARQLITGASGTGIDIRPEPDIRSRLSARSRSPLRRSRSRSPERWERRLSPERQRVRLRLSPGLDDRSSPVDLRSRLSPDLFGDKGSDLRERLGKRSKKGKLKYPPMKIEVFD